MSGFLGMTSIDDWPAGVRPKNWRQGILWLYPNGRASLTAMLAMAAKESVDDYEFNWLTEIFPEQRGSFTAGEIYTDPGLSSAYGGSGTAGQVLYVKTTAAVASEFRKGHQALLRDADDLTVDINGKVVAVQQNGANSYVGVKLLEADDNASGGTGNDLQNADTIRVVGNINPQGGVTPNAISYQPEKFYNYTQIFRTPLEIARTLMKIRSYAGKPYKNLKKLALELHSVEMEWASLFGIATENTGDNGLPETTTEGIITFLRNNLSTNVRSFKTDSAYAGQDWLEAGDDYIVDSLEILYRYADKEGITPSQYSVLCGSGTKKHLGRLARQNGQIQMVPGQKLGFGINTTHWVTEFGTFNIVDHPLFNQEPTMRNTMLLLKPKNFKYCYIDDTKFYGNAGKPYGFTTSGKRIDGLNEEFLTEMGLKYYHPQTAMFLTDIGVTNTAS